MQIHAVHQGTPEWHAYRAEHNNASDAPAMMGCSPYKTRAQLLYELHTGLAAEVDPALQRRFDDGHRFEALARPLAEEIIGESLYPVVASEGRLSASFDGLTMDERAGFEHKTLNDELRSVITDEAVGYLLPLQYRVQMEQQCAVAGCERILFMASKWEGDTLVEERHCWYYPDLVLRRQILEGWDLLHADLLTYAPPEVVAPAPVGKAPDMLPALHIEVTGMVTASNLDAFREHALDVFKGINRELKTDADFADAEKTVKWCGDVESRLEAAKDHALSQTASIDELFRTIDEISAEANRVRLDLNKLVKDRKEAIRGEIVSGGVVALREHILALNERIGRPLMPVIPADFAGVIKNKRTIDSLRDAVNTELNRAKIAANEVADRIALNLREIERHTDMGFLFPDGVHLVLKQPDDLVAVVKSRLADHAEKEAKRKADEEAKALATANAVIAQAAAPAVAQVQAALSDAINTGTGIVRMSAESVTRIDPATVVDNGATLKLGEINARLAPIQITADGLAQMGFKHIGTNGAAKLYRECDFPRICAVMVRHLTAVSQTQAA